MEFLIRSCRALASAPCSPGRRPATLLSPRSACPCCSCCSCGCWASSSITAALGALLVGLDQCTQPGKLGAMDRRAVRRQWDSSAPCCYFHPVRLRHPSSLNPTLGKLMKRWNKQINKQTKYTSQCVTRGGACIENKSGCKGRSEQKRAGAAVDGAPRLLGFGCMCGWVVAAGPAHAHGRAWNNNNMRAPERPTDGDVWAFLMWPFSKNVH